MSEVQPMTEKTPISLGLALVLFGLAMSTVGSFAVLKRDVDTINSDIAKNQDLSRRLDRIEYVMCVTDDASRAAACRQLQIIR